MDSMGAIMPANLDSDRKVLLLIASCVLGMCGSAAHPGTPVSALMQAPSTTSSWEHKPLGLSGPITSNVLVEQTGDGGEEMVFVGTSHGLYVLGSSGELRHFQPSASGVKRVVLVDDFTGDGVREVLVLLGYGDAPVQRCYDGVEWKEMWHFAPTAKMYVADMGWTQVQLDAVDLVPTCLSPRNSV